VPGLIVPNRLEHRELGPFAFGRRTVRLQHAGHMIAELIELLGRRANDMASHQR